MKQTITTRALVKTVGVVGLLAIVAGSTYSLVRADDASSGKQTEAHNAGDGMVTIRTITPEGTLSEPHKAAKLALSEAEWKQRLTPEQFRILRSSDTERPFCGGLLDNKETGLYVCAGCNLPMFDSRTKFESGSGWPSFYRPAVTENVAEKEDVSHGMTRVEINCARCDGHLGHVFNDGPPPTGLRYCLNSAALKFVKETELKSIAEPVPTTRPAVGGND